MKHYNHYTKMKIPKRDSNFIREVKQRKYLKTNDKRSKNN